MIHLTISCNFHHKCNKLQYFRSSVEQWSHGTHWPTHAISVYETADWSNISNRKKNISVTFLKRGKCFLRKWKHNWRVGGGRILLCDTTGGGAVRRACCWRSGYVWANFSWTGSYTHSYLTTCLASSDIRRIKHDPDHLQRYYWQGQDVPIIYVVQLRKHNTITYILRFP
jgi:hypothetical protein